MKTTTQGSQVGSLDLDRTLFAGGPMTEPESDLWEDPEPKRAGQRLVGPGAYASSLASGQETAPRR